MGLMAKRSKELSALAYGLITWCNQILGTNYDCLFSSLQPACYTFLSLFFLGSPLYLGRNYHHLWPLVYFYLGILQRKTDKYWSYYECSVSDPLTQEKTKAPIGLRN
ncbi:hypothetical protein HN51_018868 [Arachis hypogaea]